MTSCHIAWGDLAGVTQVFNQANEIQRETVLVTPGPMARPDESSSRAEVEVPEEPLLQALEKEGRLIKSRPGGGKGLGAWQ